MRALQVYMVDMIATEYEARCSALNVVVNKALGCYQHRGQENLRRVSMPNRLRTTTKGFHVPNEHMMTRGKNRDRREVDPANTTGKSI